MNIAYLSDVRIPSRAASVVHVVKMCESLAKLGHNVTLFYPTDSGRDGRGDLGDVFKEYGVEFTYRGVGVRKPKIRGMAYWYSVKIAWLTRSAGCQFALSRNVAAAGVCALLGVPVILEAHMPTREKGFVTHSLVKFLGCLGKVRGLVVISEALAGYFRQTYRWKKKLLVAPDAAPVRKPGMPPADDLAVSPRREGKLNVGYTGHLYKGRGIEILVEIARQCEWVHMHIVGGEPGDVEKWRDRCSELNNVTFYGHVGYASTDAYREACDVLVAPYQETVIVSGGRWNTADWMSPLKIFEYMSSRRAIVSSDLPVLREVLRDGENALLCRCENVGEWIAALRKLRDNPRYRSRLAETAYRDYEEKYTWDKRAETIVDFCHENGSPE